MTSSAIVKWRLATFGQPLYNTIQIDRFHIADCIIDFPNSESHRDMLLNTS